MYFQLPLTWDIEILSFHLQEYLISNPLPQHTPFHSLYKTWRKMFVDAVMQTSGLHKNAFCIIPINMDTSFSTCYFSSQMQMQMI